MAIKIFFRYIWLSFHEFHVSASLGLNFGMKTARENIYILLDGLTYNTRAYCASCVAFFRAPQGRGKIRAMSKMSTGIIC